MKCTTYEQLHLEMVRVYKMCVGTAFEGKEYLCVKYDGKILAHHIYNFFFPPSLFEFALGIVEDKPVFAGDILYHEKYGRVTALEFKNHNLFAKQTKSSYPNCGCLGNYSWNPPAPPKPKTALLPCPFCGNTEINIVSNGIGDYFAICGDDVYGCGARTSAIRCESKEHASDRWNIRGADKYGSPLG